MKNVLIFGQNSAAYRPSLMAKYFIDRPELYHVIIFDPTYFADSNPIFRKIAIMGIALISLWKCDLLLFTSMFHHGIWPSFLTRIAKRLNKRLIVDMYISIYETQIVDRGRFSASSSQAKVLFSDDATAIQQADPAVFLTKAEKDYYTQVLELPAGSFDFDINPLAIPLRSQARLPYLNQIADTPTIVWWGRMGNPLHGFEVIAAAIHLLVEEGFEARFALFGANDQNYEAQSKKYSDLVALPNVLFSSEYSFNNGKLTHFLENETDLALGTFGNTKKAKIVLTNKVLDSASFGIPCLTQYSAGMLEFFEENKTVLIAEIRARALADTILLHFKNPQHLLEVGQAGRKLVESTFSPGNFETRFGGIIED